MEAIRKPEGIMKHVLVVSILFSILQNVKTVSVSHGPAETLISKNLPRLVKQGGLRRRRDYSNFEAPDYLFRLRERHNREWTNFGQAEQENAPNLGIITSIRHHRVVGPKKSRPKWQGQQSLDFRLAAFPKNEMLVASSLRLPIQRIKHKNSSIPVKVEIVGAGNIVGSEVFVEGSTESWLNVPLPPATLYNLLKRRQILRLSVSLDGSRLLDSEAVPHVLTFHRNTKRSGEFNRIRRDVGAVEKKEGDVSGDLINKEQPPDANRKKRRRKNRTGKNNASSREKRSPQYLMNKRYIESTCQRRDLMVNFNTIGWSKWVIAPMAYNAGYCYGYCPFPLSAHFNTTNHAIILHLMHNLGVAHSQVNSPCCTPLTFGPQSILFFDGDDVILQVYEDMIVESCGCR